MLFEELIIQNFGVYKGRHAVNLRPTSPTKPIILFGALNGGGKTTFLDALQLTLYGKFSNCSNRGALSYNEYLSRAINSHVDPKDGASLELHFSHINDGHIEQFRIVRTWRSTGKGVKEDFEVFRNNRFDPVITERWYEYVEEFIPSQISSLFFFDGEKIEALADSAKSAQLLRTGIHALLGLDLVDQLAKDLLIVEGRRKANLSTPSEQKKAHDILTQIQKLEQRSETTYQEIAQTQSQYDQLVRQENDIRAEFRRQGGELLQQRETIEAERLVASNRLSELENQLREVAAGFAPLILVRPLLRRAESQARKEHAATLYMELRDEIVIRDKALISHLKKEKAASTLINAIKQFQTSDLSLRDQQSHCDRYIHIDPGSFASFSDIVLDQIYDSIGTYLAQLEHAREVLTTIERTIASIPDPSALAGISDRLNGVIGEKDRTRILLEAKRIDHERVFAELELRRAEYRRYLEATTYQNFADESSKRILKHTKAVRSTLALFRQAVATQHISKVESLILESFKQLIRKGSLVDRVAINLESYRLTLYKRNGDEVSADRLSAGERQLLAVSILWGLAKASGRPLPTVIDTPLGRLDGTHRRNLVNAYFPYASHQVILLSTDEEIDEEHHEQLKSAISREYLISYDQQSETSEITSHYFW